MGWDESGKCDDDGCVWLKLRKEGVRAILPSIFVKMRLDIVILALLVSIFAMFHHIQLVQYSL